MGMYAQLHLHDGDDVTFEAKVMEHNRNKIDLAITHSGGYLTDLAITMALEQAVKLRDELNSIIEQHRAPDTVPGWPEADHPSPFTDREGNR